MAKEKYGKTQKNKDILKNKILKILQEKKPDFTHFLKKTGKEKILMYYKKTLLSSKSPKNSNYNVALEFIAKETKKRLGVKISNAVFSDLKKHNLVGTADHHSILSSPFFAHNPIIEAFTRQSLDLKTIPIISCGNIPIDNSTYPRGIFFFDKENRYKKVPILSLKNKKTPTYLQKGFGIKEYEKFEKLFENNSLNIKTHKFIKETIKSNIQEKDFAVQITKINHTFFKNIFPNLDLVYIDQETLVWNLLLKYHIPKETLITNFLFNENTIKEFIKNFDGIQGAFDSKISKGSILFWYLENGHMYKIIDYRDNSFIIENGEKIKGKKELIKNLKSNKLVPTMALCFIVLAFYHKLECGGGFSQIGYLPKMQKAFDKIVSGTKFKTKVITKNNIYRGDIIITEIETKKEFTPATFIDILEEIQEKNSLEEVKNKLNLMSVEDGIIPILADLHTEIEKKQINTGKKLVSKNTHKILK